MSEVDRTTRFFIKRRRLRRIGAALLGALLLFSLTDQFGLFGSDANDWNHFDRTAWIVVRVMDGGTLVLKDDAGRSVLVDLLGVAAPNAGAYWGDRAAKYASARALNNRVTLALDGTQTRDESGRVLCYVYLSDTESLNLAMVRDGQAFADRRVKHAFRTVFEQAETAARTRGTGLWKELRFEQMPMWRQRWLDDLGAARRAASGSKIGEE